LGLRGDDRQPMRAFWRSHFEVWELSGLTQRQYCERHGLNLKSFGNWRAQLKREDLVGADAKWGRYPRLRPRTSPMTRPRTKRGSIATSPAEMSSTVARVPAVVAEPRGRRRFSEGAKKRIVEETCQPGASVSGVARRYGIATALLFRWRQALGAGPLPEGTSFLPVRIADDGEPAIAPQASGPPATPSIIIERPAVGIEIELIGGRRVRFDRNVDPETMKRVVSALEGGAP
jgi:transposase